MVFVPTNKRLDPSGDDDTLRAPARPEVNLDPPKAGRSKLAWRAIVHAPNRESVQIQWHLVTCAAPADRSAHCSVGQELIANFGDPDGHCLVGGYCARCSDEQASATSSE